MPIQRILTVSAALVLFLVGMLGTVLIPLVTFGPSANDPRFEPAADQEAEARRTAIGAEVATLGTGHAWAGEYSSGLALAPLAGFVLELGGCQGPDERNFGRVVPTADGLELVHELPNVFWGRTSLPTRLIPVAWGGRHYLAAPEQMDEFCARVNSGWEPRRDPSGWPAFLRLGDEQIEVTGLPDVPAEYRSRLRSVPIVAHITWVGPTSDSGFTTEAEIDAGTEQGVTVGLEMEVVEPDGFRILTAVEVRPGSSRVTVENYKGSPPVEVGWTFDTLVWD